MKLDSMWGPKKTPRELREAQSNVWDNVIIFAHVAVQWLTYQLSINDVSV